jgi:hypothetical protein
VARASEHHQRVVAAAMTTGSMREYAARLGASEWSAKRALCRAGSALRSMMEDLDAITCGETTM